MSKANREALLSLVDSGVGEVVPAAASVGDVKTLHKYLEQNSHEVTRREGGS